jgi:hypothetical protein
LARADRPAEACLPTVGALCCMQVVHKGLKWKRMCPSSCPDNEEVHMGSTIRTSSTRRVSGIRYRSCTLASYGIILASLIRFRISFENRYDGERRVSVPCVKVVQGARASTDSFHRHFANTT